METERKHAVTHEERATANAPLYDRPDRHGRVLDPVCCMRVLTTTAFRTNHAGRRYHFCSQRCLLKFRQDPTWYVSSTLANSSLLHHMRPDDGRPGLVSGPGGAVAWAWRDPVCRAGVSPDSPHRLPHQGELYRFCTERCLEEFRARPERYVASGRPKR